MEKAEAKNGEGIGSDRRKIIIVEGTSDRDRLLAILAEEVTILCTNGTLSYQERERLAGGLDADEIYVLTDADEAGNTLRRQLRTEIPQARHLYTRKLYREIATTPSEYLATILNKAHFAVK
ncbi:MAG: toprim domain-containing protein, partial [Peptococcaceae bacterium]|nr:toprim domain-containing protein [Peptococcaceae bacterium]